NIRQGSVPAIWKCADVIPVPKVPNPRSNYSDLRPISLTPVLMSLLSPSCEENHHVSIHAKCTERQYWLLYCMVLKLGLSKECR
ncbi:hypothetical protein P5673_029565, partial [Acropora cervicornis]